MDSETMIDGASADAASSLAKNCVNSPMSLELDRDRMSILPDDLLHHILSFLPTKDSIRTSVLSRRWQRVWIGLPAFSFNDAYLTKGFAGSLDKVLAHGHGIDRLEITISRPPYMARANAWLQQAADRVRGKVTLVLPLLYDRPSASDPIVLELPCGGRAAALSLEFNPMGTETIFRVPAATASSAALTELELMFLRLHGGGFSDFVSASCPNLTKLRLVLLRTSTDHLSLSNDALKDVDLDFQYEGGLRRLQVSSRRLRRLRIGDVFLPELQADDLVASFRTPRLEELSWACAAWMHPSSVEFAHSMASVRDLRVGLITHAWRRELHHHNKLTLWLLQHCTGLRSLKANLLSLGHDPNEIHPVLEEALAQYEDLMERVPQLSNVTELNVTTLFDNHAHGASMAKLISRCNHIEKLTVIVRQMKNVDEYACEGSTVCWCKHPVDWREQELRLDCLREVDFMGFTRAGWLAELASVLRSSRPEVPINGMSNVCCHLDPERKIDPELRSTSQLKSLWQTLQSIWSNWLQARPRLS